MLKQSITFPDGKPLTRRSAAQVVQTASRFASRIMIEHDQKIVNAKSMLGLLSLGTEDQFNMQLLTEGEDELAAAEAIQALMASGMEE